MYKDALQFKSVIRTLTAAAVDPTAIATPGDSGDVLFGTTSLYIKQDSGTTTNWLDLAFAADLDAHLTDTIDAHDASAISFLNGASGLAADQMQEVGDELDGRLDTAEGDIVALDGRLDTAEADILAIDLQQVYEQSAPATVNITETEGMLIFRNAAVDPMTSDPQIQFWSSTGGQSFFFDLESGDFNAEGNINTTTGTVSGGDIVTAGDLTVGGYVVNDILDEDTMVSDSATALASQQSIKAYADSVASTAATNLSNHLSDATDAHDASAISVVPTGDLAADDVQEGLVELQGDIDTAEAALTTHEADTSTHGVSGTILGTEDVLDEDNFATNSAVYPPSQQSAKAYQDNQNLNILKADNSNYEVSVGSVVAYDDAGVFVDGTGGSPLLTAVRNTAAAISGAGSLLASEDENADGEGLSLDFVLPPKWRIAGLPIEVCFDYSTTNVDTTNYYNLVVYDKDGAAILLQETIPSGATQYCTNFPAQTTDDYRIAFHLESTSAAGQAIAILVDDISIKKLVHREIDQSAFVGSLTWAGTASCVWTKTTSAYGNFADDTDCDNTARTVDGLTDHTAGLKPNFTIPNAKTGMKYSVTYAGNFIKNDTANNACIFRLSYESTTSNRVAISSNTHIVGVPSLTFEGIEFSSPGSKAVELHVSSTDNTSECLISAATRDLMITVQAFPDETATVFGQQVGEVRVIAGGNATEVITAGTTNIPFIESEDTTGSWDGDEFTAPLTMDYIFEGTIAFGSSSTRLTYAYKSVGGGAYSQFKYIGTFPAAGDGGLQPFKSVIRLNAGDKIALRVVTNGGTLANTATGHTLFIRPASNSSILGTYNANQIIDGVSTPDSGIGKARLVSALVDASEVVTEDSSNFIASCTNAAPSVCTFESSFFDSEVHCWSQGASSYVSANSSTQATVERSAATTPFTLFCKGLAP